MRIYVDFDDVLCETARDLSRLAAELHGCRVAYDDIRDFNLRVAFGLDEIRYLQLMREAHAPGHLLNLAATPGAIETLAQWRRAGHEVEIVTGRPYATHAASRAWLARHGLEQIPLVHVDKYSRELAPDACDWSRALTVAEFAQRHYDLAVEDAPVALRQLAAMPSCRVAIFSRPWNHGFPLITEHFTRCPDWAAVREAALRMCEGVFLRDQTLSPAGRIIGTS